MSQDPNQPSLLVHPVSGQAFSSPVPPGLGWPDDEAGPSTRSARSRAGVRRLAATAKLRTLSARISVCRACPRLVWWREQVAVEKRAAFADQPYWGRPVPGFGVEDPAIVIVGLAPAAHGANRTGRNFTGDRSGDWLFASLHRVGLARLPTSVAAGDGQQLLHTRLISAVRCAPPDNAPTPAERDNCVGWLAQELRLVAPGLSAIVVLGNYSWQATWRGLGTLGLELPRPRPRFGHGVTATVPLPGEGAATMIASYHPSQHNTFTGRLTEAMMDEVFVAAKQVAGL